jgi:hypothetical protein
MNGHRIPVCLVESKNMKVNASDIKTDTLQMHYIENHCCVSL